MDAKHQVLGFMLVFFGVWVKEIYIYMYICVYNHIYIYTHVFQSIIFGSYVKFLGCKFNCNGDYEQLIFNSLEKFGGNVHLEFP